MAEVTTGTSWNVYDANTMSPKEIYGRVLTELAKEDDRIVGVTADLAKSTNMGIFYNAYPERVINVGIAEQNMMGVAAGLAKVGFIPFASTFGAFACMRAGEQFRTDICYQKLNVKVVATHSGVSFGAAGSTHHCTEDFSIVKAFPNVTLIAPADGEETGQAIKAIVKKDGPCYVRIGRGFELPCPESDAIPFEIGKAKTVVDPEGADCTIIACGICVRQAVQAAQDLDKYDNIKVRVVNMHTIKPIDADTIMKAVADTRRIITVEEHNVIGGLGDSVAAVIAESGKGCAFTKVGIPDCFAQIGYPEDLYAYYGLDSDGIADKVREVMKRDFEQDEVWEDEV